MFTITSHSAPPTASLNQLQILKINQLSFRIGLFFKLTQPLSPAKVMEFSNRDRQRPMGPRLYVDDTQAKPTLPPRPDHTSGSISSSIYSVSTNSTNAPQLPQKPAPEQIMNSMVSNQFRSSLSLSLSPNSTSPTLRDDDAAANIRLVKIQQLAGSKAPPPPPPSHHPRKKPLQQALNQHSEPQQYHGYNTSQQQQQQQQQLYQQQQLQHQQLYSTSQPKPVNFIPTGEITPPVLPPKNERPGNRLSMPELPKLDQTPIHSQYTPIKVPCHNHSISDSSLNNHTNSNLNHLEHQDHLVHQAHQEYSITHPECIQSSESIYNNPYKQSMVASSETSLNSHHGTIKLHQNAPPVIPANDTAISVYYNPYMQNSAVSSSHIPMESSDSTQPKYQVQQNPAHVQTHLSPTHTPTGFSISSRLSSSPQDPGLPGNSSQSPSPGHSRRRPVSPPKVLSLMTGPLPDFESTYEGHAVTKLEPDLTSNTIVTASTDSTIKQHDAPAPGRKTPPPMMPSFDLANIKEDFALEIVENPMAQPKLKPIVPEIDLSFEDDGRLSDSNTSEDESSEFYGASDEDDDIDKLAIGSGKPHRASVMSVPELNSIVADSDHSMNEILDQIEEYYSGLNVQKNDTILDDLDTEEEREFENDAYPGSRRKSSITKIESIRVEGTVNLISMEVKLKKQKITLSQLLISLDLSEMKPKFQAKFSVSSSKLATKKLVVTILDDCILMTDGAKKVRILSTEYLQATVYINSKSSKDNTIELYDSSNGYKILLKSENSTDLQMLAGVLTSELRKQMKKFEYLPAKDDIEIVSVNDFFFNFVLQPEQLTVGNKFEPSLNKLLLKLPFVQVISNLYKVIPFEFKNEQFLIAGGESGLFVSKRVVNGVSGNWIKVASLFKIYDLIIIKDLLIAVSNSKMICFNISDIMTLYNAPSSTIKEIRGFTLLQDFFIGLVRFKNGTLYVTSLPTATEQKETILALEPLYDIDGSIRTFRKKYSVPTGFDIYNLQLFEKTMVTVSATGFYVTRVGGETDPLPTLNEGLGFNSFPTHTETTSVEVANYGTPVDFLKVEELGLCLLVYTKFVLVCDLYGKIVDQVGFKTEFFVQQARFVKSKRILILNSESVLQMWKLKLDDHHVLVFEKLETYLSRFVRAVSESSDVDNIIYRLSAVISRKQRVKVRSEQPLSDMHAPSSSVNSSQPQMIIKFS